MNNITQLIEQLNKSKELRKQYFDFMIYKALDLALEFKDRSRGAKQYLKLTRDKRIDVESFNFMYQLVHSIEFTLEERKENYERVKLFIDVLTKNYQALVQQMNKCAQFEGYRNQLEFALVLDGIKRKDFELFLKNVDRFISLVHNNFSAADAVNRVVDWSPVNIPAPMGIFNLDRLHRFKNSEEIISLISKRDPRMEKYKDKIRIKIGKPEDLYGSSTRYVAEKKLASVTVTSYLKGLVRAMTLVHEIGHALDMIECEENKIIYYTLKKFSREYSAVEFECNFMKRELSDADIKRVKYNFLNALVSTLFEIDIYTNDTQNFDQAYARAIKRCYPKAQQTTNPLYVFNKGFIFRPLDGLVYCMAYVECYLKDAGQLKTKILKRSFKP